MTNMALGGTPGDGGSTEEPNFNPLLRLIFDLRNPDQTDRVTISQWAKALQKVHQCFEENPNDLSHNASGKVFDHIRSAGGVAGLTTELTADIEHDSRVEDDGQPNQQPTPGPSAPEVPSEATEPVTEGLGRIVLAEFAKLADGMGTVELHCAISVGNDGFVAILARKHEGRLIVHASTDDAAEIESLAACAAMQDSIFLSPILRAIVETVQTQSFPSYALQSSPDKREEWAKRHTAKSLLLNRGTILLSSPAMASLAITRCVPTAPLIAKALTLCLDAEDATRVETWLYTNETALLRGDPALRPANPESGGSADYTLGFSHVLTGRGGVLKLRKPDAGVQQPDFNREGFTPRWEIHLDAAWFQKLANAWTNEWFKGLGRHNQILRSHNATLGLEVTAKKMVIEFNRHSQKSATETIAFPSPIKTLKRKPPASTTYLSKDLAPVLYQLTHSKVTGSITMLGNEHALVFRYATSAADFEIAIPTLDADEKHRNSMAFHRAANDDGKPEQ